MSARKRGKRCRDGHALESDCVPEEGKKRRKKKEGREKRTEAAPRRRRGKGQWVKDGKEEENGTGGRPNEPHQHQPHSTLIPAIIEIRGRRRRHVPRGDCLLLSYHTVSQPTGTRECSARENRDAAHTAGMRLCPRYLRRCYLTFHEGEGSVSPFTALLLLLLSAYQFLSV